jgi:hypothetical protein
VQDGRKTLDAAKLFKWLDVCDEFVKALKWRAHLTGGHPGRPTELVVQRMAVPPWGGGERNVFLFGRDVAMLPDYNKSRSIHGIVRVPDTLTSALLKFHMLFLSPIYWGLVGLLRDEGFLPPISEALQADLASLLYVQGARGMTDEEYRQNFKASCVQFLKVPLSPLNYRHLDAAMTRYHLTGGMADRLLGTETASDEERVAALQFGHHPMTNKAEYGRPGGGASAKVSTDFPSQRRCSWTRNAVFFQLDLPASMPLQPHAGYPFLGQALAPLWPYPHPAALWPFPPAWQHPPLPAVQAPPPPAPPALPTAARLVPGPRPVLSAVQEGAVMGVLSLALRPGQAPFFKDPVLAEALHYATTSSFSMLVVAATGSGKGALMLALSAYNSRQGKWTIVTVPLKALKDDLLRRAKELRLTAYAWSEIASLQCWDAPPGLVLITPEGCMDGHFSGFLDEKTRHGSIAHVIHDEAHYRIDWATFR